MPGAISFTVSAGPPRRLGGNGPLRPPRKLAIILVALACVLRGDVAEREFGHVKNTVPPAERRQHLQELVVNLGVDLPAVADQRWQVAKRRRVADLAGVGGILGGVAIAAESLEVTDCTSTDRVRRLAPDDYIDVLARSVAGKLGGKVGIAPRLFLKKLVSDVLDRIDQFEDFDPTKHYQLTINTSEMTAIERESQAQSVDDIELDS
jgi:P-loop Domain of unknown function (DUF2791)